MMMVKKILLTLMIMKKYLKMLMHQLWNLLGHTTSYSERIVGIINQ